MLSPEAVAALTAELTAINRQLAEYEALLDKKNDILAFLGKWAPKPPPPINPSIVAALGRLIRDEDASKADRIAQAAQTYLSQIPNGVAPFIEIFNAMPVELFGDMKHPREYARTALTRKGGDYGVVYEDAEHVRLVRRQPRKAIDLVSGSGEIMASASMLQNPFVAAILQKDPEAGASGS